MTEHGPKYSATLFRWSRYCVFTLYGLWAFWGAVQVVFPGSDRMNLLLTFMSAIAATYGARFDALARSKPMLPILQMLFLLLWPIGSVIYFLSRSGWRGLGIGIMLGVGLICTFEISFYATFYGLHFAGLLDQSFYQPP